MKNLIIFFIASVILLFPNAISAQEIDQIDHEYCYKLKKTIEKSISKFGECWETAECQTRDLGYPWSPQVCHHTIISKQDDLRVLSLQDGFMKSYDKKCIQPNPQLRKKQQNHKFKSAGGYCKNDYDLVCLNGKCVTQTHILLQDPNPGIDPYGSKGSSGTRYQPVE